MTSLKIAVASSGLGHVARGIEAWAADLAESLYRRGVDVRLYQGGGAVVRPYEHVLPCWQRGAATAQRLHRLLPRRLSWRFGLGSTYGLEQFRFGLAVIRRLRRESIDILHVQDPQLARLINCARILGFVRTKTILAHGTEESDAFLARLPYVQHLAPWHQQDCASRGCANPNWTAIPNFIDVERYRPVESPETRCPELRREFGIPENALVVLSVAAIKRHHKRIDHLLDEFAGVPERIDGREVRIIVAGGREADTDELVELATCRFGPRARILVGFSRDRMPDLYRAADVFVLCSLKEMMPIALLEAVATGLPALTHPHPVMQWMAGPGGVGVDMAATGVLATALTSILADDEGRVSLGAAARNHCLENFECGAVVTRILEYYRQILNPLPSGPRPDLRQGVVV